MSLWDSNNPRPRAFVSPHRTPHRAHIAGTPSNPLFSQGQGRQRLPRQRGGQGGPECVGVHVHRQQAGRLDLQEGGLGQERCVAVTDSRPPFTMRCAQHPRPTYRVFAQRSSTSKSLSRRRPKRCGPPSSSSPSRMGTTSASSRSLCCRRGLVIIRVDKCLTADISMLSGLMQRICIPHSHSCDREVIKSVQRPLGEVAKQCRLGCEAVRKSRKFGLGTPEVGTGA